MISVIVCTYDREQILARMLKSFFEQKDLDKIDYEFIIIDNNSAQDSWSVAKRFMHSPKVSYVHEKEIGLSFARNRGIAESKGEIVAFLDDDVVVDTHWLHKLQECFQETGADVVAGRSHLLLEKEEPIWLGPLFKRALSQVDLGSSRSVVLNGNDVFGLNLAIRKPIIQLAGRFNEKLGRRGKELIGGEETDLLRRISSLKKKIVYDPEVIVHHIIDAERLDWDYFVAQAVGWGKTLALLEGRRNWLYQLLRVGNAFLRSIKSIFTLIRTNLSDANPYEKKAAKWQAIRHVSHCVARWKQLWE